ncbi:dTMP kinase [Archangium violaceum]|uniref:dTMP kinase n=1 Tax=Archangium violaceum TaxID=83451 RepID=UPI0007C8225B|nr:dTMP kinase [Archangium violaceum]
MQKRHLKKGLLLVIEGIDGAGKTTQAERLHKILAEDGWDVIRSKEPTDGKWGRKLRESATTGRLSPEDELELFMRDRKEHVKTLLNPALEQGKIVIVDRYYFSTAAYQGARGFDPEEILRKNEEFAPPPNLLVFLDVEPEEGVRRIRKRGDRENLFEERDTLAAVAKVFRSIKRPYLHPVNGMLPPDDITHGLIEKLYAGPLSSAHPQEFDAPTSGDLWMEQFALVGTKGHKR